MSLSYAPTGYEGEQFIHDEDNEGIDPRLAQHSGSVLQAEGGHWNCNAPNCTAPATPNGYCFAHANHMGGGGASGGGASAQACVEDIYKFEKDYLQALEDIIKSFVLRLNKLGELGRPVVTRAEIDSLFLNICDIRDLHKKICDALDVLHFERKLKSPDTVEVYQTFVPFLKMYQFYVNNYGQAEKKMLTIRQQRDAFGFFMNLSEACEGKKISDFMILPVQYLPEFLTKLHTLFLALPQSDPMKAPLERLTQDMDALAQRINTSFRENEARQRVVQIQALLEPSKLGVIDIVTPHRYHVLDGPLEKQYNNKGMRVFTWKKYWFFLFNDLLMYTTVPNAKGKCKVKYQLPLVNMTVSISPDAGSKKRHGFEIKSSVKSFFLSASTPAQREKWISALNQNIKITHDRRSTLRLLSPSSSPPASPVSGNFSSPSGTPGSRAPIGQGEASASPVRYPPSSPTSPQLMSPTPQSPPPGALYSRGGPPPGSPPRGGPPPGGPPGRGGPPPGGPPPRGGPPPGGPPPRGGPPPGPAPPSFGGPPPPRAPPARAAPPQYPGYQTSNSLLDVAQDQNI